MNVQRSGSPAEFSFFRSSLVLASLAKTRKRAIMAPAAAVSKNEAIAFADELRRAVSGGEDLAMMSDIRSVFAELDKICKTNEVELKETIKGTRQIRA